MKTSIIALGMTLLAGAAVAQDTTRTSVDWEGRYVGTLPCASCPGIETALTINEAGFYTLDETYLEEAEGNFLSEGEFTWDTSGSVIALKGEDEQRSFFIGEGMAWMVSAYGKTDDDHTLTKLTEFNGAGAQLYVDPQSVSDTDGKPTFDGLMNFEHETQGGHRSLRATFQINCATREVDMPSVSYFPELDAKGETLYKTEDNAGSWTPIPQAEDDVMAQAMASYCTQ